MRFTDKYHIPVLKKEAVDLLNVRKDLLYLDCNLGGGGHTREILNRGGRVIGVDMDISAIKNAEVEFANEIKEKKLILIQTNFSRIDEVFKEIGNVTISGVLYDLGVSTHQLETPERGFSFNLDASLDMRMDQSFGLMAKDLVNALNEGELIKLFETYGEERFSRKIAKKIIEERKREPIETTDQLAKIVLATRQRFSNDKTHPATRVFQALRIAVNDEINSLKESLPKAFELLEKNGRIAVISFHSLEDRVVKNYFKNLSDQGLAKLITKKPIESSDEEVEGNPRSRSGKLRVIEKL